MWLATVSLLWSHAVTINNIIVHVQESAYVVAADSMFLHVSHFFTVTVGCEWVTCSRTDVNYVNFQ